MKKHIANIITLSSVALFLLPLTLTFVDAAYGVVTICALATLAVMQEVYLIARGREVV